MTPHRPRARRTLLALTSAVLLVAPACGGDDGPTAVSLADYPDVAAVALCEQAARCLKQTPAESWHWMAIDAAPAACATTLAATWPMPDLERLVAEGRISFDASAVGACLHALKDTCADAGDEVWPCLGAMGGNVAAGGPCESTAECAGDTAYCRRESGEDNEACPGVCQLPLALGASCESTEDCVAPGHRAYCDRIDKVCVAFGASTRITVKAGESCGEIGEGDTEVLANCPDGFACTYDAAADDEVCVRTKNDGEPCDETQPCGRTSMCVSIEGETSCQPIIISATEGALCRSAGPRYCNPYHRLVCGDEGVCVRQSGELGSGCSSALPCISPYHCSDWDGGECVAKLANDEACNSNEACGSGYCSDEGACAPPVCD